MGRQDRLSRLVDYIVERGTVRVDDIVERFAVSGPTARRDLDALAEQQLVERTRGGARANPTTGDVPLRYRTSRHARQKGAIAHAVAAHVRPGSVIAFNGGTTTTAAAYELGVRAAADPAFAATETTVVTNAVNIANDLVVRPHLRIVVLGGVARARSYELTGPLTGLILPQIAVDTLFLGVTAVDTTRGLFTTDDGEAVVNAALVAASRRTVVIADSSKFEATAFARICGLEAVEALITDEAVSAGHADGVRDAGVDLIVA